MEQPEGFVAPDQEKNVCKLIKSMYRQNVKKKIDMKDMWIADMILRIKIGRTSDGISLTQSHYMEKVLKKFNVFDGPPSKTPIDLSINLVANKVEQVAQLEYSKVR
ncbi:hypothetical protein DH2020_003810 [Rehmannia glutinosa]|uniref:Reverse transcriptase Ty1/copia-type domain-containing protein n=1 Tax=Rehmannia glutinosa TaxID=99300 RepID=A0ABR0XMP4_REHGL